MHCKNHKSSEKTAKNPLNTFKMGENMQNMGKTMGNTHIHGFSCLCRIPNILAPWTNTEENKRQRKSDPDQMAKLIVLHPFSIHTPF